MQHLEFLSEKSRPWQNTVVEQEAKYFFFVLLNRLLPLIGFYYLYTYNGKSIVCPTSCPKLLDFYPFCNKLQVIGVWQ